MHVDVETLEELSPEEAKCIKKARSEIKAGQDYTLDEVRRQLNL